MIVCSCNCINHHQIHNAVDDIVLAEPAQVLTPARIYKQIGSRPKCGSCLSHAAELIHKRIACLRDCDDCPFETRAELTGGDHSSEQRLHHGDVPAL